MVVLIDTQLEFTPLEFETRTAEQGNSNEPN